MFSIQQTAEGTADLSNIIAATVHNIQPRVGDNIRDFTAINMWYDLLDKRYNFSLGLSILGLMTSDNLIDLTKLDPPYLNNYNNNQEKDIMFSLIGINLLVSLISMTILL